jgi:hypothetical protein
MTVVPTGLRVLIRCCHPVPVWGCLPEDSLIGGTSDATGSGAAVVWPAAIGPARARQLPYMLRPRSWAS